MSALSTALVRICSALSAEKIPFALIGGLAVSARTEPRFTRDIDLAVAVPTSAVDALGRTLRARGFVVDAVLAAEPATPGSVSEVAGLRLFADQVRVDLLLSATGLEAEACATAERIELLPGVIVPVVTLPYLLLFKLVAVVHRRRKQDEADIDTLIAYAQSEEREQAAALINRLSGAYRTDVGVARQHWLRLTERSQTDEEGAG